MADRADLREQLASITCEGCREKQPFMDRDNDRYSENIPYHVDSRYSTYSRCTSKAFEILAALALPAPMADRVDFKTRQELAKGMLSAAQRHTKLNGDGTATLPASNLSAVFNELALVLQRETVYSCPECDSQIPCAISPNTARKCSFWLGLNISSDEFHRQDLKDKFMLALPAEPRGDEEELRDVIEYDRDKLWCDVLFNADAGELGPKVHTTPEGGKKIMDNLIAARVPDHPPATSSCGHDKSDPDDVGPPQCKWCNEFAPKHLEGCLALRGASATPAPSEAIPVSAMEGVLRDALRWHVGCHGTFAPVLQSHGPLEYCACGGCTYERQIKSHRKLLAAAHERQSRLAAQP